MVFQYCPLMAFGGKQFHCYMSRDYELGNEWARCSRKNANYITTLLMRPFFKLSVHSTKPAADRNKSNIRSLLARLFRKVTEKPSALLAKNLKHESYVLTHRIFCLLRLRLHGRGLQSKRFHDLETASKMTRFQSVYTEPIQALNPTFYVKAIWFSGLSLRFVNWIWI